MPEEVASHIIANNIIIAQMTCTILLGIFIPNFPKIHKTTKTAKTIRANFKSAQQIKMKIAMIFLL